MSISPDNIPYNPTPRPPFVMCDVGDPGDNDSSLTNPSGVEFNALSASSYVPAMALKRALNPMPDFVRRALEAKGLMAKYEARPAYQRNDYLWWIASPKREDTRQRRLAQMLDELKRSNVYMKMKWRGTPR